MTRTESEGVTKNGKGSDAVDGFTQGIVGSVEGLTTIAREQATESFKQGEIAAAVLRDQSIVSIKAAEVIGLSFISTLSEVAAPVTLRLPILTPTEGLDTMVKAGFDVVQQLLDSERKLALAAVELVAGLAA